MTKAAPNQLTSKVFRAYTGIQASHIDADTLYINRHYQIIKVAYLKDFPIKNHQLSIRQRARADALAIRQQQHNSALHQQHCPEDNLSNWLFEIFEQLRIESLLDRNFQGAKKNLQQLFAIWSLHCYVRGMLEKQTGLLIYTIVQVVRGHLTHLEVIEPYEGLLEATRAGIAPLIGTPLYHLKKNTHSQQQFAVHANQIITIIRQLILNESDIQVEEFDDRQQQQLTELLDLTDERENDNNSADSSITAEIDSLITTSTTSKKITANSYAIFDDQFDQVVAAATLIRPAQLSEFSKKLHQQWLDLADNHPLNHHLARLQLEQRLIQTQQPVTDNHQAGIVDSNKLTQIVTNPSLDDVFFHPEVKPLPLANITLLIDLSGSMRQYHQWIALFCLHFNKILQHSPIQLEVLGFTTRAWQGGRPYKIYQKTKQSNPSNTPNPGRLNELNHIVFKSFQQTFQELKQNIGLLLKPDIYKEGIDGEAIKWSCQRLLKHNHNNYPHNILITLSDGYPMDSTTQQHNPAFFLQNDISNMINHYQQQNITIIGIAVNSTTVNNTLPSYYDKQLHIDTSQPLNNQLFNQLSKNITVSP